MSPINEHKGENINELFIRNMQEVNGADFGPSDGFVLYVDGMRFIPENAGIIKINLRGYTNGLDKIADESLMFPDLASNINMPIYHKKRSFVIPNVDPTLIVLASLEVYDTAEGRDKILGYLAINAFIDGVSKQPVTDPKAVSFRLNEGDFQIPIYCETILETPFTMGRM
jgi:hypothetical protein